MQYAPGARSTPSAPPAAPTAPHETGPHPVPARPSAPLPQPAPPETFLGINPRTYLINAGGGGIGRRHRGDGHRRCRAQRLINCHTTEFIWLRAWVRRHRRRIGNCTWSSPAPARSMVPPGLRLTCCPLDRSNSTNSATVAGPEPGPRWRRQPHCGGQSPTSAYPRSSLQ